MAIRTTIPSIKPPRATAPGGDILPAPEERPGYVAPSGPAPSEPSAGTTWLRPLSKPTTEKPDFGDISPDVKPETGTVEVPEGEVAIGITADGKLPTGITLQLTPAERQQLLALQEKATCPADVQKYEPKIYKATLKGGGYVLVEAANKTSAQERATDVGYNVQRVTWSPSYEETETGGSKTRTTTITGGEIPKDWLNASVSDKTTMGMTQVNGQWTVDVVKFKGDQVMPVVLFQTLPQEQQAMALSSGWDAMVNEYYVKVNVGPSQREAIIAKDDWNALSDKYKNTLTTSGFGALQWQMTRDFETSNTKLADGRWMSNDEFYKLERFDRENGTDYANIAKTYGWDELERTIAYRAAAIQDAYNKLEPYKTGTNYNFDPQIPLYDMSPEKRLTPSYNLPLAFANGIDANTMKTAGFSDSAIQEAQDIYGTSVRTGVALLGDRKWVNPTTGYVITDAKFNEMANEWQQKINTAIKEGKTLNEVLTEAGPDPRRWFQLTPESQKRVSIEVGSGMFFAPAAALLPEVRVSDLSPLVWVIGGAQLATWALPFVPKGVAPWISGAASGIFGYATATNWNKLTTAQKALGIAGTVLVALPAIVAIRNSIVNVHPRPGESLSVQITKPSKAGQIPTDIATAQSEFMSSILAGYSKLKVTKVPNVTVKLWGGKIKLQWVKSPAGVATAASKPGTSLIPLKADASLSSYLESINAVLPNAYAGAGVYQGVFVPSLVAENVLVPQIITGLPYKNGMFMATIAQGDIFKIPTSSGFKEVQIIYDTKAKVWQAVDKQGNAIRLGDKQLEAIATGKWKPVDMPAAVTVTAVGEGPLTTGKNIPLYNARLLRISKVTDPMGKIAWKGLSVKGHQILGISAGKPVIGKRGIKIPSATAAKKGYQPVSAEETGLFASRQGLEAAGVASEDINALMVEAQLNLGLVDRIWWDKNIKVFYEVMSPRTLGSEAGKIFFEHLMANPKVVDTFYGSSTLNALLDKYPKVREAWEAAGRGVGDIDTTGKPSASIEENEAWVRELADKLEKQYPGRIKWDKEKPFQIQALDASTGEWHHFLDHHPAQDVPSVEKAPEGAYGFKYGKPAIVAKVTGVGDQDLTIHLMRFDEAALRKFGSMMEWQGQAGFRDLTVDEIINIFKSGKTPDQQIAALRDKFNEQTGQVYDAYMQVVKDNIDWRAPDYMIRHNQLTSPVKGITDAEWQAIRRWAQQHVNDVTLKGSAGDYLQLKGIKKAWEPGDLDFEIRKGSKYSLESAKRDLTKIVGNDKFGKLIDAHKEGQFGGLPYGWHNLKPVIIDGMSVQPLAEQLYHRTLKVTAPGVEESFGLMGPKERVLASTDPRIKGIDIGSGPRRIKDVERLEIMYEAIADAYEKAGETAKATELRRLANFIKTAPRGNPNSTSGVQIFTATEGRLKDFIDRFVYVDLALGEDVAKAEMQMWSDLLSGRKTAETTAIANNATRNLATARNRLEQLQNRRVNLLTTGHKPNSPEVTKLNNEIAEAITNTNNAIVDSEVVTHPDIFEEFMDRYLKTLGFDPKKVAKMSTKEKLVAVATATKGTSSWTPTFKVSPSKAPASKKPSVKWEFDSSIASSAVANALASRSAAASQSMASRMASLASGSVSPLVPSLVSASPSPSASPKPSPSPKGSPSPSPKASPSKGPSPSPTPSPTPSPSPSPTPSPTPAPSPSPSPSPYPYSISLQPTSKPPWPRQSTSKKQYPKREGPALAVWKQGRYWVSIFPPFRTTGKKEDVVYSLRRPTWGSVIAHGRHAPRKTLRSIGKVPKLITVPMGVTTAYIRDGRYLTFSRRNGNRRRGRVIV